MSLAAVLSCVAFVVSQPIVNVKCNLLNQLVGKEQDYLTHTGECGRDYLSLNSATDSFYNKKFVEQQQQQLCVISHQNPHWEEKISTLAEFIMK